MYTQTNFTMTLPECLAAADISITYPTLWSDVQQCLIRDCCLYLNPTAQGTADVCSHLIADDVGGERRVNLRGLQLLLLNDHDGLLVLFRNVHWFTRWCDWHVHRSVMHFPIGQWHRAAGDDVCKSAGKTKITRSTRKEYEKLVLGFLTSHQVVHGDTSGWRIKTRRHLRKTELAAIHQNDYI